MQLFLFASEQRNLGPRPATFSFAEVVALFSVGPIHFAFQLFTAMHSQILYPKATLRVLAMWYQSVLRHLRNTHNSASEAKLTNRGEKFKKI